MTEKMNEFRGSPGSMRLRRGNLGQLFHKRLPLACFVAASPAPHAKLHRDTRPLCRQILEMTLVPAVTEVDRLPQAGQEPNSSRRAKMIQRPSIRSALKIPTPGPRSHAKFVFIKPGSRSQRIELKSATDFEAEPVI